MSPRPCGACGAALREEEAVTLWCGRHWWPDRDVPQANSNVYGYAVREEYVTILCHPCAERHWPTLRDDVQGLTWSLSKAPPAEERP